jgi:hypothetical protein
MVADLQGELEGHVPGPSELGGRRCHQAPGPVCSMTLQVLGGEKLQGPRVPAWSHS